MKSCETTYREVKKKNRIYFSYLTDIFCFGIPELLVEGIILFSRTPKIEHLILRITMEKKEERLY
jgi:hypothetical protein